MSLRLAIGVMAKAPVAGEVKTRLLPVLGPEAAAALHRRLTLQTLATADHAAPGQVHLFMAGDPGHPFWQDCGAVPPSQRHRQCEGDLGARMLAALEHLLVDAEAALLIGGDCPVLSPGHLDAAGRALATADMVFIPAEDGGYVLVGARRLHAAAFRGIAWSTATVMAETRVALSACGLEAGKGWAEFPALWDIDRPDDHARAVREGLLPEG
ncbi:TIGR04282 family arsenosugar biosynthesis glycosyltransferase [Nevskia sp.]|uniref:TIGR04282 family arsenosugar biosynthesis glycosyltransferase n=1 Tax=Nevskia sp. TaxID=1929292 RepID=UPI0025F0E912|nr:TIGR04282 family arsenosugar biosynthesis glycosyltransferase [Nevskia sp.]